MSLCYDPDADYLDVFERWGFFDRSATVHTEEVVVPRGELVPEAASSDAALPPALVDPIVAALAARGCDGALEAWWLPDHNASSSPLHAAVRAALLSPAELVPLSAADERTHRCVVGARLSGAAEGSPLPTVLPEAVDVEATSRSLQASPIAAEARLGARLPRTASGSFSRSTAGW